MLRIALAALHLLALAIGFGAVVTRSAALRAFPLTGRDVKRAFKADSFWGLAAVLWLGTGLWRLLAGTEKATSYYLHNMLFNAKMGAFVLILLLEIAPMITLIRGRRLAARGGEGWRPDDSRARRIALIGYLEATIVIAMIGLATAMARGLGAR